MNDHEHRAHSVLQDTVKCFWMNEGVYSADTTVDITPIRRCF